MKVKNSEMFETKKFPQMKELKIKLHRLDKAMIKSLQSEKKIVENFNFSVRKVMSNSVRWQCQEKDGKVRAVTTNSNTIQIQIREEFEKREDRKAVNKMSSVDQVKLKNKKTDGEASETETVKYELRQRNTKEKKKPILETNKVTTISNLTTTRQKQILWSDCKKKINKSAIKEGSIAFVKQKGYSAWPARILNFTKTRSSAQVQYFGFNNLKSTIKVNEIVQVDQDSMEAISKFTKFVIEKKCVREHSEFSKAILEIQYIVDNVSM